MELASCDFTGRAEDVMLAGAIGTGKPIPCDRARYGGICGLSWGAVAIARRGYLTPPARGDDPAAQKSPPLTTAASSICWVWFYSRRYIRMRTSR